MLLTAAVGVLSGLGALTRHLVTVLLTASSRRSDGFPVGTLVVNVSGSFLLGLVTGLALHAGLAEGPTVAMSAGFCGGYTTWSTFAAESVDLLERGAVARVVGNLAGSVALGLLAAGAGLGLASVVG